MKPALFLYPHINSFPVLMLLGFVFGWWLARRRGPLFGIEGRHLDNIALILPLAGIFGARLFARLFYAKLPLLEALQVWKGDGLVFYGGFLLGVASVISYAFIRRVELISLFGCLAPSVALGLAFGRIGCFLGGCCWGDLCTTSAILAQHPPEIVRQVWTVPLISSSEWPLAVRFPAKSEAHKQHVKLGLADASSDRSLRIHPVQLYEAVLAGALCFWLHRRFRSRRSAANAALALLGGYAFIRFATEYLRADNKVYALTLTFSQVVSTGILLACAAVLLLRWYSRQRSPAGHSRGARQTTARQSSQATTCSGL